MQTSLSAKLFRETLAVDPSSTVGALGLLLLRAITGSLVFYIHGWHKLLGGIDYLRYGTPWKLVEEVSSMHFPAPVFSSFAATGVQFVCAALLIPGFCTRLNALLLTGALSTAVLQNLLAGRDPQLALLYTLNVVSLVLVGGGRFSLDAWLTRSEPPRTSIHPAALKTNLT